MRKLNWKKILTRSLWVLAGIGMIVLLGAAIQRKDHKACADIKVEITGANRHMFIDEKDVLAIVNNSYPVKGNSLSSINLRALEARVEKNPWVLHAEMYIDNKQELQVHIEERQPVARVFTLQGNSFYLDSGAMRLPLSEKLSARVPVFTGFTSDKNILAKPDSLLLQGIVKMGQYITADSFWMAQVAQVDITPQSGFEITPVIGDHVIAFGTADDIPAKFKRLYTFYRKAWLQNGMNTYEKLDVQYANQVVAVKRGTAKAYADSAKAMAFLNSLSAPQAGADSTGVHIDTKKPAVAKPKVDTVKHVATVPVATHTVKPAGKTKITTVKSNKINTKPLTKGVIKKTPAGKPKAKKQVPAKGKAKAVLVKKKNQ